MANLWGGRFQGAEDEQMKRFNSSLPLGKRYWKEDITGSIAHARMLGACGIIGKDDAESIIEGLKGIMADVESGALPITEGEYEDIHSFVELNLTRRIGEAGKRLHTARSRNDQVAVDTKLYARHAAAAVEDKLDALCAALVKAGSDNPCLMPGYTHLQRAQAVTFKHTLMAFCEMFRRDKKRLNNAVELMMEDCPLGCGALAGTTHPIDRAMTAKELGFKQPCANFLDGVSDRDYLCEMVFDFAMILMHLSRLSESVILWCSQEFHFVTLSDAYSTGSSIMPQKKNPDSAELIRGCSGLVYGSLMAILTEMKGIPLAYNKDMQLDKRAFMPALDDTMMCLEIMRGIIATMTVHPEAMKKALKSGFLNATELADYLVKHGVPFRDAHEIVGKAVLLCEGKSCAIEDLPLEALQKLCPAIGPDVYGQLDYERTIRLGNKAEML